MFEDSDDTIVCQYCNIKVSLSADKKPSDRLKEHVGGKRHNRIKEQASNSSCRQPTLLELQVRQKNLEKDQEGAIYDLVRSVCHSGLWAQNLRWTYR